MLLKTETPIWNEQTERELLHIFADQITDEHLDFGLSS